MILARAPAFAQAGALGVGRLDNAKSLKNMMFFWFPLQPFEMAQIIRPRPASGRHLEISPRFCVFRTVSVKLLIVA